MNRERLKEIIAWCLFDFGQSSFSTLIVTFIFSAYIAKSVATNEVFGVSAFGWALSLSGFLVAILSPVLGSIADFTPKKKPWLLILTIASAITTALLFFTQPKPSHLLYGLIMFGFANTFIEVGQVFYNSFLPKIAPRKLIGEISGFGWGSGYVGGLIALILALVIFIQPYFIPHTNGLNIRATTLMAAVWIAIFCTPLFIYVKDHYIFNRSMKSVIHAGIKSLFNTFHHVRKNKQVFQFLIARLIYTDGINTLLNMGGIFAAIIFGLTFNELLLFGIAMNITAGVGAFTLAKLNDRIGSAKMVAITLVLIMALGLCIVFTHDKLIFWIAALSLGLFVGPVQSASRSLMAQIAPSKMMTQMFGLYALSGKVTSFIAPFFVATITQFSGSPRLGMSFVFVLMLAGLACLAPLLKKK